MLNMGLLSSQGFTFSIFSFVILNSKAFILSTPLVFSIKAPTTFSSVFKMNGRNWLGFSMKFHETMASSTTSRRGIVYFYLATFSFVVSMFMIFRPLCSFIAWIFALPFSSNLMVLLKSKMILAPRQTPT